MTDDLVALVLSAAPTANPDALRALPVFLDGKGGAEAVTAILFPVKPRTLRNWGLTWRQINGRSCTPTDELFAEAARRVSMPSARGRAGFKHRMARATTAVALAAVE